MALFLFLIWFNQEESQSILAGHFLSFAIYSSFISPFFNNLCPCIIHLSIHERKKHCDNGIFLCISIHPPTSFVPKNSYFLFPFFWITKKPHTKKKLIPRIERIFIYLFIFSFLCCWVRDLYICEVGDEYYSVCIAYVSIQCWDPFDIKLNFKCLDFFFPFGQFQLVLA